MGLAVLFHGLQIKRVAPRAVETSFPLMCATSYMFIYEITFDWANIFLLQ